MERGRKRCDRVAGPLKECSIEVEQIDGNACLRSGGRGGEDTVLHKENRDRLAAAGGHQNMLDI